MTTKMALTCGFTTASENRYFRELLRCGFSLRGYRQAVHLLTEQSVCPVLLWHVNLEQLGEQPDCLVLKAQFSESMHAQNVHPANKL